MICTSYVLWYTGTRILWNLMMRNKLYRWEMYRYFLRTFVYGWHWFLVSCLRTCRSRLRDKFNFNIFYTLLHQSFFHSHYKWEGISFMWKMAFKILIKWWAMEYFIGAKKVRTGSLTSHIQPKFSKWEHFLCIWKILYGKIQNSNTGFW